MPSSKSVNRNRRCTCCVNDNESKEEFWKKRELLKKQIDADKKQKKLNPKKACSSKANNLQFGRKDVKVEFKTSGGG